MHEYDKRNVNNEKCGNVKTIKMYKAENVKKKKVKYV